MSMNCLTMKRVAVDVASFAAEMFLLKSSIVRDNGMRSDGAGLCSDGARRALM
jgi:hypothetical protein